jgi:hypothetical protein
LGKITKKRNRSSPIRISRVTSTGQEKFRISAGMIAIMGNTKLATYRLLGQKRPLERVEKVATFPSFANFPDITFMPDMQSEFSSL